MPWEFQSHMDEEITGGSAPIRDIPTLSTAAITETPMGVGDDNITTTNALTLPPSSIRQDRLKNTSFLFGGPAFSCFPNIEEQEREKSTGKNGGVEEKEASYSHSFSGKVKKKVNVPNLIICPGSLEEEEMDAEEEENGKEEDIRVEKGGSTILQQHSEGEEAWVRADPSQPALSDNSFVFDMLQAVGATPGMGEGRHVQDGGSGTARRRESSNTSGGGGACDGGRNPSGTPQTYESGVTLMAFDLTGNSRDNGSRSESDGEAESRKEEEKEEVISLEHELDGEILKERVTEEEDEDRMKVRDWGGAVPEENGNFVVSFAPRAVSRVPILTTEEVNQGLQIFIQEGGIVRENVVDVLQKNFGLRYSHTLLPALPRSSSIPGGVRGEEEDHRRLDIYFVLHSVSGDVTVSEARAQALQRLRALEEKGAEDEARRAERNNTLPSPSEKPPRLQLPLSTRMHPMNWIALLKDLKDHLNFDVLPKSPRSLPSSSSDASTDDDDEEEEEARTEVKKERRETEEEGENAISLVMENQSPAMTKGQASSGVHLATFPSPLLPETSTAITSAVKEELQIKEEGAGAPPQKVQEEQEKENIGTKVDKCVRDGEEKMPVDDEGRKYSIISPPAPPPSVAYISSDDDGFMERKKCTEEVGRWWRDDGGFLQGTETEEKCLYESLRKENKEDGLEVPVPCRTPSLAKSEKEDNGATLSTNTARPSPPLSPLPCPFAQDAGSSGKEKEKVVVHAEVEAKQEELQEEVEIRRVSLAELMVRHSSLFESQLRRSRKESKGGENAAAPPIAAAPPNPNATLPPDTAGKGSPSSLEDERSSQHKTSFAGTSNALVPPSPFFSSNSSFEERARVLLTSLFVQLGGSKHRRLHAFSPSPQKGGTASNTGSGEADGRRTASEDLVLGLTVKDFEHGVQLYVKEKEAAARHAVEGGRLSKGGQIIMGAGGRAEDSSQGTSTDDWHYQQMEPCDPSSRPLGSSPLPNAWPPRPSHGNAVQDGKDSGSLMEYRKAFSDSSSSYASVPRSQPPERSSSSGGSSATAPPVLSSMKVLPPSPFLVAVAQLIAEVGKRSANIFSHPEVHYDDCSEVEEGKGKASHLHNSYTTNSGETPSKMEGKGEGKGLVGDGARSGGHGFSLGKQERGDGKFLSSPPSSFLPDRLLERVRGAWEVNNNLQKNMPTATPATSPSTTTGRQPLTAGGMMMGGEPYLDWYQFRTIIMDELSSVEKCLEEMQAAQKRAQRSQHYSQHHYRGSKGNENDYRRNSRGKFSLPARLVGSEAAFPLVPLEVPEKPPVLCLTLAAMAPHDMEHFCGTEMVMYLRSSEVIKKLLRHMLQKRAQQIEEMEREYHAQRISMITGQQGHSPPPTLLGNGATATKGGREGGTTTNSGSSHLPPIYPGTSPSPDLPSANYCSSRPKRYHMCHERERSFLSRVKSKYLDPPPRDEITLSIISRAKERRRLDEERKHCLPIKQAQMYLRAAIEVMPTNKSALAKCLDLALASDDDSDSTVDGGSRSWNLYERERHAAAALTGNGPNTSKRKRPTRKISFAAQLADGIKRQAEMCNRLSKPHFDLKWYQKLRREVEEEEKMNAIRQKSEPRDEDEEDIEREMRNEKKGSWYRLANPQKEERTSWTPPSSPGAGKRQKNGKRGEGEESKPVPGEIEMNNKRVVCSSDASTSISSLKEEGTTSPSNRKSSSRVSLFEGGGEKKRRSVKTFPIGSFDPSSRSSVLSYGSGRSPSSSSSPSNSVTSLRRWEHAAPTAEEEEERRRRCSTRRTAEADREEERGSRRRNSEREHEQRPPSPHPSRSPDIRRPRDTKQEEKRGTINALSAACVYAGRGSGGFGGEGRRRRGKGRSNRSTPYDPHSRASLRANGPSCEWKVSSALVPSHSSTHYSSFSPGCDIGEWARGGVDSSKKADFGVIFSTVEAAFAAIQAVKARSASSPLFSSVPSSISSSPSRPSSAVYRGSPRDPKRGKRESKERSRTLRYGPSSRRSPYESKRYHQRPPTPAPSSSSPATPTPSGQTASHPHPIPRRPPPAKSPPTSSTTTHTDHHHHLHSGLSSSSKWTTSFGYPPTPLSGKQEKFMDERREGKAGHEHRKIFLHSSPIVGAKSDTEGDGWILHSPPSQVVSGSSLSPSHQSQAKSSQGRNPAPHPPLASTGNNNAGRKQHSISSVSSLTPSPFFASSSASAVLSMAQSKSEVEMRRGNEDSTRETKRKNGASREKRHPPTSGPPFPLDAPVAAVAATATSSVSAPLLPSSSLPSQSGPAAHHSPNFVPTRAATFGGDTSRGRDKSNARGSTAEHRSPYEPKKKEKQAKTENMLNISPSSSAPSSPSPPQGRLKNYSQVRIKNPSTTPAKRPLPPTFTPTPPSTSTSKKSVTRRGKAPVKGVPKLPARPTPAPETAMSGKVEEDHKHQDHRPSFVSSTLSSLRFTVQSADLDLSSPIRKDKLKGSETQDEGNIKKDEITSSGSGESRTKLPLPPVPPPSLTSALNPIVPRRKSSLLSENTAKGDEAPPTLDPPSHKNSLKAPQRPGNAPAGGRERGGKVAGEVVAEKGPEDVKRKGTHGDYSMTFHTIASGMRTEKTQSKELEFSTEEDGGNEKEGEGGNRVTATTTTTEKNTNKTLTPLLPEKRQAGADDEMAFDSSTTSFTSHKKLRERAEKEKEEGTGVKPSPITSGTFSRSDSSTSMSSSTPLFRAQKEAQEENLWQTDPLEGHTTTSAAPSEAVAAVTTTSHTSTCPSSSRSSETVFCQGSTEKVVAEESCSFESESKYDSVSEKSENSKEALVAQEVQVKEEEEEEQKITSVASSLSLKRHGNDLGMGMEHANKEMTPRAKRRTMIKVEKNVTNKSADDQLASEDHGDDHQQEIDFSMYSENSRLTSPSSNRTETDNGGDKVEDHDGNEGSRTQGGMITRQTMEGVERGTPGQGYSSSFSSSDLRIFGLSSDSLDLKRDKKSSSGSIHQVCTGGEDEMGMNDSVKANFGKNKELPSTTGSHSSQNGDKKQSNNTSSNTSTSSSKSRKSQHSTNSAAGGGVPAARVLEVEKSTDQLSSEDEEENKKMKSFSASSFNSSTRHRTSLALTFSSSPSPHLPAMSEEDGEGERLTRSSTTNTVSKLSTHEDGGSDGDHEKEAGAGTHARKRIDEVNNFSRSFHKSGDGSSWSEGNETEKNKNSEEGEESTSKKVQGKFEPAPPPPVEQERRRSSFLSEHKPGDAKLFASVRAPDPISPRLEKGNGNVCRAGSPSRPPLFLRASNTGQQSSVPGSRVPSRPSASYQRSSLTLRTGSGLVSVGPTLSDSWRLGRGGRSGSQGDTIGGGSGSRGEHLGRSSSGSGGVNCSSSSSSKSSISIHSSSGASVHGAHRGAHPLGRGGRPHPYAKARLSLSTSQSQERTSSGSPPRSTNVHGSEVGIRMSQGRQESEGGQGLGSSSPPPSSGNMGLPGRPSISLASSSQIPLEPSS